MGIFDFLKKKEEKNNGKIYTGLQGLIVDALEKSGDENVEIVKKIFDESEPPKTESIKENEINEVVGDMLNTGAITSKLAKKYDSVKAVNENQIEATLTAAEQELLIKFMTPTDLEYWFKQDYLSYWNSVLSREIKKELQFFIENQILVEEKSLAYKLEYKSDSDLKKICKENGLKVSGSKSEKAIRIAENLPELAEKIVTDKVFYKCNTPVLELVKQYKEKKDEKEKQTKEKCIELCFNKEYQKAIDELKKWSDSLVFPKDLQTYNINTMLFELKVIMENIPKALNGIPENVLTDARKITIINILFNENKYISSMYQTNYKYNLSTCSRLLHLFSNNIHRIFEARKTKKEHPELNMKLKVNCSCEGACYECSINSDKLYTLDNPPELPNPNCKNENGCRCIIMPEYN